MDELLDHELKGLVIGLAVVCPGRICHRCEGIWDANCEDVCGNYYL